MLDPVILGVLLLSEAVRPFLPLLFLAASIAVIRAANAVRRWHNPTTR